MMGKIAISHAFSPSIGIIFNFNTRIEIVFTDGEGQFSPLLFSIKGAISKGFNVVSQRLVNLFRVRVLDTNNIQCVSMKFLLHQAINFTLVFKFSGDALIVMFIERIGNGKRNLQGDGFGRSVPILIDRFVRLQGYPKLQTNKNSVQSYSAEKEYKKNGNGYYFFQLNKGD